MALSFAKKGGSTAQTPAAQTTPAATTPKSNGAQKPKVTLGWMKHGAQAAEALKVEEARAEAARQEGGMFRFWMPEGEERRITFLDGDLDDDGVLDVSAFYEHTVKVAGRVENFVCTSEIDETQPCPICAAGEKNALVHAFTIIDHTPHKIKSGKNAGKTIVNSSKLFIAKRNTMQILTKAAVKRGGLAGCTFDITRIGDKSPGVGSQYDFVEKLESAEEIAEKYGITDLETLQPADYEKEIQPKSVEQLLEMGIGKKPSGVGYEKGIGGLKDSL